jgi:hypothetical protein
MTDQEIAGLGPAFASFLRRFRGCFLQGRTARHFDTYCRGLLSDLPRKSVEPIALGVGTAVRTLQLFLTTANRHHQRARDTLQRRLVEVMENLPQDRLGTVGVIDEASAFKQGDKPPACNGSTSAAWGRSIRFNAATALTPWGTGRTPVRHPQQDRSLTADRTVEPPQEWWTPS